MRVNRGACHFGPYKKPSPPSPSSSRNPSELPPGPGELPHPRSPSLTHAHPCSPTHARPHPPPSARPTNSPFEASLPLSLLFSSLFLSLFLSRPPSRLNLSQQSPGLSVCCQLRSYASPSFLASIRFSAHSLQHSLPLPYGQVRWVEDAPSRITSERRRRTAGCQEHMKRRTAYSKRKTSQVTGTRATSRRP